MKKNKYNKGFVKEIFLLIIVVIILSYLGVSVKEILDKEAVKNNFLYIWEGMIYFFNNYIIGFFKYLFNLVISANK